MRLTRRTGVLLTILTLLTVLGSLSACGYTTIIDAPPQTITTPVTTPTTPTPSIPTIPQSATTLGGSVVSFDKKFGASNCCYENGWQYHGPYGLMWTGVNTDHTPASNVDENSTQRVIDVENAGWMIDASLNLTMSQAKALCGSFLPADAKVQHTSQLAYGSELRYTSSLLANTLPASDFVDASGKATARGTFFVYYATSGGTVASCGLATDESLLNILS